MLTLDSFHQLAQFVSVESVESDKKKTFDTRSISQKIRSSHINESFAVQRLLKTAANHADDEVRVVFVLQTLKRTLDSHQHKRIRTSNLVLLRTRACMY